METLRGSWTERRERKDIVRGVRNRPQCNSREWILALSTFPSFLVCLRHVCALRLQPLYLCTRFWWKSWNFGHDHPIKAIQNMKHFKSDLITKFSIELRITVIRTELKRALHGSGTGRRERKDVMRRAQNRPQYNSWELAVALYDFSSFWTCPSNVCVLCPQPPVFDDRFYTTAGFLCSDASWNYTSSWTEAIVT